MTRFTPRRWTALAAVLAAGALLMALASSWGARDLILYNHSSSIPVGLYVRAEGPVSRGAVVTVRARDVAPDFAATRQFTDAGDRFIKRVAAADGDLVCSEGASLRINGTEVARRLERDLDGRLLPTWSGCRALARDEVLLLGDTHDSFDGRYWGPVSLQVIEGVWRPVSISPQ